MDSNFIDYVNIFCRSGKGGAGSRHFRKEKFVPQGGPDGGNGGRGGHIIVKGNKQLWTLLHLKYKKHIKAGHGAHGAGNLKTGSQGSDEIIEVPLGTVAKDAETGEILFEITENGAGLYDVNIIKNGSDRVRARQIDAKKLAEFLKDHSKEEDSYTDKARAKSINSGPEKKEPKKK